MPRNVSEFRIVVASPMDMSKERQVVFASLEELNRSLDVKGLSVKALGWEEYTTPGVGVYPQDVVNNQLLKDYDILIGLFGTRLGTPTSTARSGTIEEIDRALSSNDNAMGQFRVQVYFLDRLDSISSVSLSELQEVTAYREELGKRGVLHKIFRTSEELSREIRVNVQRSIDFHLNGARAISSLEAQTISRADVGQDQTSLNTEGPGLLDLMETSEAAINSANAAVNLMTDTLNDIAMETNRQTQEIEKISSPEISSSIKKDTINRFASLLKEKAVQLKQSALAARMQFDSFFAAQKSILELGSKEGYPEKFWEGKEDAIAQLMVLTSAVLTSREGVEHYKQTVEALPRMTIQFNQARKQLVEALAESLELANATERNVKELLIDIDKLSPK